MGIREKLPEAVATGIPIIMFVFSIIIFTIVFSRDLTSLAISLVIFTVIALSLKIIVDKFYSRKIFFTICRWALNPIINLAILFVILRINTLSLFGLVTSLTWVLSSALFAAFVARVWLHSLRGGKNSFQTARLYLQTQKFRWYTLGFVLPIFVIYFLTKVPILSPVEFLFWTSYLVILSYYFAFLFVATIAFYNLSNHDFRKYCEIGLTEVKKGLETCSKRGRKEKNIFIKDYLPIFSKILNLLSASFEDYYPDLNPHLPDLDIYVKALFASVIKDEPRLDEATVGIEMISKALNAGELETPIDFIGFVEGLCLLEGKEPKFPNVPEAFEITPSFEKSFKEKRANMITVAMTLIGIVIAIYVPVRFSAPEGGYKSIRSSFLGEGVAKILFPIGEAHIELQQSYVELLPPTEGGISPLKGEGHGEYFFYIKNNHYKNIEIENVSITGPTSITSVGLNLPENTKKLINLKITSSIKVYPADNVIHESSLENVTIILYVDYDLSALGPYLENIPSNEDLSIFGGGVQISVSYEIGATGLTLDISKNMLRDHTDNFNFLFSPKLFENSKIS